MVVRLTRGSELPPLLLQTENRVDEGRSGPEWSPRTLSFEAEEFVAGETVRREKELAFRAARTIECTRRTRRFEKWMVANGRKSARFSRQIYGDPTPDPVATETTIVYLLM